MNTSRSSWYISLTYHLLQNTAFFLSFFSLSIFWFFSSFFLSFLLSFLIFFTPFSTFLIISHVSWIRILNSNDDTKRRHIGSSFEKLDCYLLPYPGRSVAEDPNFQGQPELIGKYERGEVSYILFSYILIFAQWKIVNIQEGIHMKTLCQSLYAIFMPCLANSSALCIKHVSSFLVTFSWQRVKQINGVYKVWN